MHACATLVHVHLCMLRRAQEALGVRFFPGSFGVFTGLVSEPCALPFFFWPIPFFPIACEQQEIDGKAMNEASQLPYPTFVVPRTDAMGKTETGDSTCGRERSAGFHVVSNRSQICVLVRWGVVHAKGSTVECRDCWRGQRDSHRRLCDGRWSIATKSCYERTLDSVTEREDDRRIRRTKKV